MLYKSNIIVKNWKQKEVAGFEPKRPLNFRMEVKKTFPSPDR